MVGWGLGVALVFPAAMSAGAENAERPAQGIATVATIGYGGFLVGPPMIGFVAGAAGLGVGLFVVSVLLLLVVVLAPRRAARRPRSDAGPRRGRRRRACDLPRTVQVARLPLRRCAPRPVAAVLTLLLTATAIGAVAALSEPVTLRWSAPPHPPQRSPPRPRPPRRRRRPARRLRRRWCTTTTEAGRRREARGASPRRSIMEKIRPTSLPLRTMAIATAVGDRRSGDRRVRLRKGAQPSARRRAGACRQPRHPPSRRSATRRRLARRHSLLHRRHHSRRPGRNRLPPPEVVSEWAPPKP